MQYRRGGFNRWSLGHWEPMQEVSAHMEHAVGLILSSPSALGCLMLFSRWPLHSSDYSDSRAHVNPTLADIACRVRPYPQVLEWVDTYPKRSVYELRVYQGSQVRACTSVVVDLFRSIGDGVSRKGLVTLRLALAADMARHPPFPRVADPDPDPLIHCGIPF